ncbi:MAG: helix-turn-helix transcriptional regulator [Thermomicrobiales bacterium]
MPAPCSRRWVPRPRSPAPTPTPSASPPRRPPRGPTPPPRSRLTAREAEVLRLVAQGLTDPQIAARLFLSRHTVNSHLKAIYAKLGVNTRAAATRLAADHGLA